MSSSIAFAVLLHLIPLVTSNPVAPADPTITQAPRLRQRDLGDFIGYYSYGDSYTDSYCSSDEVYYTAGPYVRCCATTSSDWEQWCADFMYTTCSDSSIFAYSDTYSCDGGCGTESWYTSNTIDGNYYMQVDCVDLIANDMFYDEPDFSTTTTTADSTDTSSASTTATPGSTSSKAASQTASPTPPASTTSAAAAPHKESKAWIAGVVVGAAALIAIAGMAFYLMRQRKRSKEGAYQVAPQMQSPQQTYPQAYLSPPQNAMSPNPSAYQSQETKGYYSPAVQNAHMAQSPGDSSAKPYQTYPHYGPPLGGPQTHIVTEGSAQMPAGVTAQPAQPAQQDLPELASTPNR